MLLFNKHLANNPDKLLGIATMTLLDHEWAHSPSGIQVALSKAAVFQMGGWVEPECWNALIITVSFIAIVTTKTKYNY